MTPPAILGIQELGKCVPPDTEHAVSVSLPTWQNCVDYMAGKEEIMPKIETGYPRFFPHFSILMLDGIFAKKFGKEGEQCLTVRSKKVAEEAEAFIRHRAELTGVPVLLRHVHYTIEDSFPQNRPSAEVHIIFYTSESLERPVIEFWEYTGLGISSRFADYCLSLLPDELKEPPEEWRRDDEPSETTAPPEGLTKERTTRIEDRSSDLSAPLAKEVLRKRIARAVVTGKVDDSLKGTPADLKDVETRQDAVQDVTEKDVFLYPGGMAAIWYAYNLCLRVRPATKSVVFGMPYFDTFKLLGKWGPGAHFYGFGHESDMDAFERLLEEESRKDPTKPPILALLTELPSNPLLRSPDIPHLRALADKYDFLIIIDETLGNFVNVEVLPYADIVITSLTKVFSGVANVMGGSLVLNPKGRHYTTLANGMADYEDLYFDEDAVVMERNSRDMVERVRIIDANTEVLCDYLHERSVAGGSPSSVIKEVFYPKFTDTKHYLQCKRPGAGFGGLFTLTFKTMAASKAFFDTLPCYKGPTIGTNFTLALPYVIFVFLEEIPWAESYGMPEGLVRVSVGMEDQDLILRAFDGALKAAEATQQTDASESTECARL